MEYTGLYPFWEQLAEDEKAYIEQSCYKETYEKGEKRSVERYDLQ